MDKGDKLIEKDDLMQHTPHIDQMEHMLQRWDTLIIS